MFHVAAGTVPGRAHVLAARNNQDAFCWCRAGDAVVAVVADGCSGSAHSEVGAWLGARAMATALCDRLAIGQHGATAVKGAVRDVLDRVRDAATGMGGPLAETLDEFFLFTLVGAVVGPDRAVAFGCGDGVLAVDGGVTRLRAEDNRPAYPAYAMDGEPEVHITEAGAVDAVAVGTDGAGDIDTLAPFWEDDRYYGNPFALSRRLVVMSRARLLPDDTTLVVMRRARTGG